MDLNNPAHVELLRRTGELSEVVALRQRVKSSDARVIEATIAAVAPYILELRAEIAELKKAVEGVMRYKDVWREGEIYQRGDVVTHNGAEWRARNYVDGGRPGQTKLWQLICKSNGK